MGGRPARLASLLPSLARSLLLFSAVLGVLRVALASLRVDAFPVKLPVEPIGLGLGVEPGSVHGLPFSERRTLRWPCPPCHRNVTPQRPVRLPL